MAVASGFFNANENDTQELDRKYSSEDFGGLFDGVITDGVFKNYKNAFKVTPAPLSPNGLGVFVDTGRAWYNKTWTLNSSQYRLDIPTPPGTGYRRDAVVLRVDRKIERKNEFLIRAGRPENSLPEAKVPDLENTSDGKITEYLIAVLEVKAPVGNISPNDVTIKSTIYEPDESPSSAEIRIGITADKVAHYSKALVPTDKTVEDIIQSLEKAFDSYQQDYQHQFDEWFQEIKDSLGVLSNDQVMKLSLLVGEIYASDYVSGKYPAVVNDELWLSTKDNGELPEVDINFGYASLPFNANGNAKEVTVHDKKILYSDKLLYSVGDYVWYGDPLKLYVCITNIEVAESWNNDHWEEVTT